MGISPQCCPHIVIVSRALSGLLNACTLSRAADSKGPSPRSSPGESQELLWVLCHTVAHTCCVWRIVWVTECLHISGGGALGASQENPRSFLVYYVTWLPTRIMGGGLLRAIAQGVAVYYGGLLLGRACEPWNPIACSYWSHESLNCIACLYWSWF